MKSYKTYAACALILICTTALFIGMKKPPELHNSYKLDFQTEASAPKEKAPVNTDAGDSPTQVEQQSFSGITEAEGHNIDIWMREHGYPSEDDAIYQSYDVETLAHLAESGDILAIQALGDQAYQFDIEFETVQKTIDFALHAYTDAAVRGSTYALTLIGSHKLRTVDYEDTSKEMDDIIDGLAYYHVALLRGDLNVQTTHIDTAVNVNNLTLSTVDQQRIQERAQIIYNELQQKRKELGLADYDNRPNETILKLIKQHNSDKRP